MINGKWICLFLVVFVACTSEKAPRPAVDLPGGDRCDNITVSATYVEATVRQYCTNPGCHRPGGPASAFDFTTMGGLRGYINGNRDAFRQRVTSQNPTMPPAGSNLPPRAFRDSIECWISKGLPE